MHKSDACDDLKSEESDEICVYIRNAPDGNELYTRALKLRRKLIIDGET